MPSLPWDLPWRRRKPSAPAPSNITTSLAILNLFEHPNTDSSRPTTPNDLHSKTDCDDEPNDTTDDSTSSLNSMPYITPTAVLPPRPLPFAASSSSPVIPFPAAPSSPALSMNDFAYDSNTSLNPLPALPRSKAPLKPRLMTPTSSSSSAMFTVHPPTPDRSDSPPKSKRVRGQRTTTFSVTDSPSSDSDSGNNSRDERLADMATVGRKRGEMMRYAASADALTPSVPTPTVATLPVPTPTAAPVPKVYSAVVPGQGNILRLNMEAIKRARSTSPSAVTPSSMIPKYNTVGPSSIQFVRKKSGELVKPALRPSRTNSTMDATSPVSASSTLTISSAAMFRRNSAPTTPTPKNVHFDAQLEHVKLFLAEQKPAAVSRDGSPTPYGSTTEEESYPWQSGRRSDEEERARGKLSVKVQDGCDCVDESRGPYAKCLGSQPLVDVKLESLVLTEDGKNLKGNVVVRNIAYDKRVTARFTMDWWQTTSEVVAKYVQGVSRPPPHETGETHDRFTFLIRLADVLPKIEEKTMFVALRYNVDGKELWDNNMGGNYKVTFDRTKGPTWRERIAPTVSGSPTKSSPVKAPSPQKTSPVKTSPTKTSPTKGREWSPTKPNVGDQMAELRKELERVVLDDDDDDRDLRSRRPVFKKDASYARKLKAISLASNSSSPSFSPLPSPSSASSKPPTLNTQFSTRYDLNAALQNPQRRRQEIDSWNPPPMPSSAMVYPPKKNNASSGPSIPFPRKRGGSESPEGPLGSPRDLPEDSYSFFSPTRLDDEDRSATIRRGRNHQRGSSYFDGWMESVASFKMTPPGTPKEVLEQREEQEVDAALSASISTGSLGSLETAVETDTSEDDETEKEQETEVLGMLGLARVSPSPTSSPKIAATRYNSFPQTSPHMPMPLRQPYVPAGLEGLRSPSLTSGESIASTPSATSASSPSQSPSSPPHSLPTSPSNDLDVSALLNLHGNSRGRAAIDSSNYNFFLDRFCFYTGGNGSVPANDDLDASGFPRRIHSESEVDTYFATTSSASVYDPYPRANTFGYQYYGGASGHTTPTTNSPGKGGVLTPRAGTPSTDMTFESTTTTPMRN